MAYVGQTLLIAAVCVHEGTAHYLVEVVRKTFHTIYNSYNTTYVRWDKYIYII